MTELWVAKKFLLHAKRGPLPALVSFSLLGILLSTGTMLVVLGVMTGFHQELKARILGITPHITVKKYFDQPIDHWEAVVDTLKRIPGVKSVSPYIMAKVMLKHDNYFDGGLYRGIPQETVELNTKLKNTVRLGKFDVSPGHAVMGSALASALRIMPGDTLEVIVPSITSTPLGPVVKRKSVVISGIMDTGLYDYNTTLVFGNLTDLQDLLNLGNSVYGIELEINDPMAATHLAKKIESRLGYPYRVISWTQLNHSLFAALHLEKITMFLLLALMVVIASFTIVATLSILVNQKSREIGILRTIGFTKRQILTVFLFVGIFIGIVGILSGLLTGYGVSFLIVHSDLAKLPPDVYFIDRLPILIKARDVLLIVVSAFLIILAASLFPARTAANLEPVEAIRYE